MRSRILSSFALCLFSCALVLVPCTTGHAYSPLAYLVEGASPEEVEFIYWQEILDAQPITVTIYDAGTPDIDLLPTDPAIDEFEAMELSYAAWESIPGVNVQFDVQYGTTHAFDANDGENCLFFDDIGYVGYGGVTIITYDTATGRITDADIHMNDNNISWFTSLSDGNSEPLEDLLTGTHVPGEYRNDIQGLVTHEIGHLLGMDHSAAGYREWAGTPTMYALGIWNVPGEGDRPPNSYYRSLEPDDIAGMQAIYELDCLVTGNGSISGVVHDDYDEPLFGGHVVARNTATDDAIGCLSGVKRGTYVAEDYELLLPPGTYEVRVHAVDGSPPTLMGPWNYGGIADSLCTSKFPTVTELETTYHHLASGPADATHVTVAGCGSDSIDFRPLAKMNRLPNFVRIPNAFSFEGSVNDDVTGPLSTAELSYAVDGGTPMVTPVPTDGSPFSIPVARQASGSLIEYSLSVETTSAETFETKTRAMQTGLSGEPLVMVSKNGSFEISAVDTKTMHEIDATADGLSYPLGQAFHKAYYGLYSANFGSDDLTFTPFWNAELLPLTPLAFDTDGDGLLDALEPLFGTDSALPDTDGDRSTDGVEISEFRYTVSGGGPTYFEIVGGTVAGDGLTPIGSPYVNLALYDVTGGGWATGAMRITPSGRYRMKLTAGNTYRIYFYDAVGGGSLGGSSDFSGAAGEIVDAGVKQVALSPPAPPTADTGTDPLDPLWGAGLFVPGTWGSYFLDRSVALESGADPWDVVLSPDGLSAYVSGSGTDKVYRIDTASGTVADEAAVGTDPKGLDLTPDGAKLYVANNVSQDVSVLNAATLGPITTIPLSSDPWGVSITEDGASAVVTTDGTADLAFLDVATDSADGTLDLSFSHLYFLGARMPSGDDALAGPFQFGTHELAVIDIPGRTASTIDLGASIDATAGVAWNPDEDLGYAVHYGTPELLEFDSATGAVQRTCPFEWIDIRDISLVEAPVLLRDDSIAALQPPPDVSDVFPLRIYRDPAPELPFTDEAGLLSDPTRPLVFYRYLGIDTITLTKDETIGIESVIIDQ